MTIPMDLDEAASIDGAGPFKTLTSVALPQAWLVIVAVSVFHLVYSWNDFFGPLLYTAGRPELQTVAPVSSGSTASTTGNPGSSRPGP